MSNDSSLELNTTKKGNVFFFRMTKHRLHFILFNKMSAHNLKLPTQVNLIISNTKSLPSRTFRID